MNLHAIYIEMFIQRSNSKQNVRGSVKRLRVSNQIRHLLCHEYNTEISMILIIVIDVAYRQNIVLLSTGTKIIIVCAC